MMRKILFLILVTLAFTNVDGQNYIQTTSNNPGANNITHEGELIVNRLSLKTFFKMYSPESGFTNRRLTLNTNEGEKAFVYYYDATAQTFHTINIGGSNSLSTGLTVLGNGKVGIGSPMPNAKLEIKSSAYSISEGLRLVDSGGGAAEGLWIQFAQANMADMAKIGAKSKNTTSGALYFSTKNSSDTGSVERMRIEANGYVGIGTKTPNYRLDVQGNMNIGTNYPSGDIKYRIQGKAALAAFNASSNGVLYINRDWETGTGYHSDFTNVGMYGNVGIGTDKPNYKLDVIGTIRTQELKVDMQGADFVFEEDYNLRALDEVEAFVKENKHLPEIAPAAEMQANGVNQSEMNQKLLQKIEELTLYLLQQNKKMEAQSGRIDALTNQIKELQK